MVLKVSDCGRKHLALMLSLLGLVAALLAGFWWNQQANASLLEVRCGAGRRGLDATGEVSHSERPYGKEQTMTLPMTKNKERRRLELACIKAKSAWEAAVEKQAMDVDAYSKSISLKNKGLLDTFVSLKAQLAALNRSYDR